MIRLLLAASAVSAVVIAAAPTANADPMTELMAMVPPGYADGSCQPLQPTPSASAMVRCENNTLPDGPGVAIYWLAVDPPHVQKIFADNYNGNGAAACPGDLRPPPHNLEPARLTANGVEVGSKACLANGSVLWSDGLFVGLVQGADLVTTDRWFGHYALCNLMAGCF